MLTTIFFDLDDTLYPRRDGLMQQVGARIQSFAETRFGMSAPQASAQRKRWREKYGTALRGMTEEGYAFDLEDFFSYVHDVPLDHVKPDPRVREMLLGLPLRRAILTNADDKHAARILSHLGIADCFERVIHIKSLGLINKPHPEAYEKALAMLGVTAKESALVEDSAVNTRTAKALGMTTILVDCPPSGDADWFISEVWQVGDILKTFVQP